MVSPSDELWHVHEPTLRTGARCLRGLISMLTSSIHFTALTDDDKEESQCLLAVVSGP
jgi:hypothetical protein